MNKKQRKTLLAVFTSPTPKSLPFSDMESLFRAVGCEVIEGDGSRIAFKLRGARVTFHRPHPGKEAKEYQIEAAKDFFKALGIIPEL
jgi:hypothetical protein